MLDRLLSDPRYALQVSAFETNEGNLLERTERHTAAAQLAVLTWVVSSVGPPKIVIETGTNKALFGLALSQMMPDGYTWRYLTCDPNSASAVAVQALAERTPGLTATFYHGASLDRLDGMLEDAGEPPHLVWIDGDHTGDGATFDLVSAMDARAVTILVDDVTLIPGIKEALDAVLASRQDYLRVQLGIPGDTRGIVVLARREPEPEPEVDDDA
jgi:hypothetical protein